MSPETAGEPGSGYREPVDPRAPAQLCDLDEARSSLSVDQLWRDVASLFSGA